MLAPTKRNGTQDVSYKGAVVLFGRRLPRHFTPRNDIFGRFVNRPYGGEGRGTRPLQKRNGTQAVPYNNRGRDDVGIVPYEGGGRFVNRPYGGKVMRREQAPALRGGDGLSPFRFVVDEPPPLKGRLLHLIRPPRWGSHLLLRAKCRLAMTGGAGRCGHRPLRGGGLVGGVSRICPGPV